MCNKVEKNAGGAPAQSCEGRTGPSLHPPHPWPTLLFFFRQPFYFYKNFNPALSFYIHIMKMRKASIFVTALALLYGSAVITAAEDAQPTPVKNATVKEAPAPGSPGDTLTREDARMAYLVYKLLDKKGKIKGANLKRGAKLFYQNCRPCHGEDGHRINFNPMGEPAFIGQRAREDMPTFWYQMNFGDEDRKMESYYDEISLDEMKDIAGYAQTLP
jgi:mono/diheme cytochrome c family protein